MEESLNEMDFQLALDLFFTDGDYSYVSQGSDTWLLFLFFLCSISVVQVMLSKDSSWVYIAGCVDDY